MNNEGMAINIVPIANGFLVQLPFDGLTAFDMGDMAEKMVDALDEARKDPIIRQAEKAVKSTNERRVDLIKDENVTFFPTMKEALAFLSFTYENQ